MAETVTMKSAFKIWYLVLWGKKEVKEEKQQKMKHGNLDIILKRLEIYLKMIKYI